MKIWLSKSILISIALLVCLFNGKVFAETFKTPSWVKGKIGTALEFDGIQDYVDCGNSKELNPQDGLTVAFWVNAKAWTHQAGMVVRQGAFEISQRAVGNGGIYFNGFIEGSKTQVGLIWAPEKFSLFLNKWYHVTLTYDAKTTEARAYLDGKLQAVQRLSDRYPDKKSYRLKRTKNPLILGKGLQGFTGILDDVYIYNRPLSQAEIKKIFQAQSISQKGLEGGWTFEEKTGTETVDVVDSKKNAKLSQSISLDSLPKLGKCVSAPVVAKNDSATIWIQRSADKVMKTDKPFAAEQVREKFQVLSLARNESESFQIVISPKEKLGKISIAFSDLKLVDGDKIIKADDFIEISRVDYIPVFVPSDTSTGGTEVFGEAGSMFNASPSKAGWYPDPLSPTNTAEIKKFDNITFWVTVFADKKVHAGVYQGICKIETASAEIIEIPLRIKIWDFTLPDVFHTNNTGLFRRLGEGFDLKSVYRNFARHHFSITPFYPEVKISVKDDKIQLDTTEFDKMAHYAIDELNMNALYFPMTSIYWMPKARIAVNAKWNGVIISKKEGVFTKEFLALFSKVVKKMADHLREKGWLEKTRIALVDEPHSAASFELCRQLYKTIKSAAPDLSVLVTKWPRQDLIGSADIWCLGFMQPRHMDAALKRNEKLEFYPNWHPLIDKPTMNTRILGWIMWKNNLSGLLIWKMDHGWGKGNAVWKSPRFTYPNGRVLWGNGLLLYPGANGKVVNSIRWEAFRDAVEDYEYLYMLKEMADELEKSPLSNDRLFASESKKKMNKWVQEIAPYYEAFNDKNKWKQIKWSTDVALFETIRCKVAKEISQIRKRLDIMKKEAQK